MTQLRQRVERLETAATTSTQYGATSNDLANFPGMMNLVAGSGVSFTPGTGTLTITATGGGGTVTSVGMSVPSFLSVSGSPVTGSGTLAVTYSGTALPIANGGSGQTTANAALNAFLPSQATHTGKVLQTDGANTSWVAKASGTVTSVGVSTGTSGVGVTGSPVTTAGTIDLDLGTLANVDDAPSDGTTYARLNGTWVGVSQTDTGILIAGGGLLGAVLDPSLTSSQIRGMCTGTYDYSTASSWQLWVSPTPASGTFTLDVWKRAFGNTLPSVSDSVCAGAYPTLTGNGTDFTASGATSTWTGSLVRSDMLTVAATVNTAGVKWWALYIPAKRTF